VRIAVTNAAPVAADDSYTVRANRTLTIAAPGLLGNDSDADGDTLTVTSLQVAGLQGSVAATPDGQFVFTPTAGFVGNTQFGYTMSDGLGGTATGVVHIAVVNATPAVADDSYTVHAGQTLTIAAPGMLANDSDADGDTLAITSLQVAGLQGSVAASPDGQFVFTPTAGFVGNTQFGYTVTDGYGGVSTGVVRIAVTNAAPVAADDSYSVRAGQTLTVAAPGLLGNDSDADGDALTITSLQVSGLQGSVAASPDGQFVFTPTAGFVGNTQFGYIVSDGVGGTSTGIVRISVGNATPVAADDSYTVHAGQVLTIPAPGLLANDSDADGDALSIESVDTTGTQGTVQVLADGRMQFTPTAGFVGDTQFSYRLSDGFGGTATGIVRIAVTNAAPVAANDSYTVIAGQVLDIPAPGVLGNDSDADGDSLVIQSVDINGTQGTVQLLPDGSLRFTPAAGFSGATSFSYLLSDGLGGTATGRVDVNVLPALPTLKVDSFQATDTGFRLRFDRAIDRSLIQQYGAGALVPDVDFTGPTGGVQGRVAGSLVFDADGRGLSFVKTGGLLEAGNYQLRLNAGADGFVSLGGLRLDGNGDGAAGDHYVRSFTVAASSAAVLAVQEFARGPGQAASYDPALGAFAVSLARGAGFQTLGFDLNFDPALLHVTGATLASGLPAGSSISSSLVQPGVLRVQVTLGSAVADAALRNLVLVQATVPLSAGYGEAGVLRLSNVSGNAGALRADDGLHVVANLGDADGSRTLTTTDVGLIQAVAARTNTGFSAYTLIDPTRIADVNRDGKVNAADALQVLNASRGIAVPAIPAAIAAPVGPVVTRITSEADGFSLRFDRAINTALIQAYGTGTGGQDLWLDGPSGRVGGSVFFDADGQGLRFVTTSGLLPAGSYSLTLKSGAAGFTALTGGQQLDGNADGTTGDDFTASFMVGASSTPAISVGNLVAPVGAANQVLSLQVREATGARNVYFQLAYDPASLHIDAVNLAATAPAGSVMSVDTSVAGRLGVQLTLGSALPDAALRALVDLRTSVPAGAVAGSSRLLSLLDLSVDGAAARSDLGVQVVAVLGDASGNGRVEREDVGLIQAVAARSDTGFAAQPLLDPVLLADLNRDGRLNAADALLALRLSQQQAAQAQTLSAPAVVSPTSVTNPATVGGASPANAASSRSLAATAAPAPVVKLSGALDFGLKAPLPSSVWVNDWVAGKSQTVPNDWKVTI
jgi:Bacterial Ig domain/Cadherin-like domain/Dockerin type I domain